MMQKLPLTMAAHTNHAGTVAGTMSGTLLTLFANIHSEDLVKTAVLALIGAIVSFVVSLGLRWIVNMVKR